MSIRNLALRTSRFLYQKISKPTLFLFDAETAHNNVTSLGRLIGHITPIKWLMEIVTGIDDPIIKQNIHGIDFSRPIGLAAGFDYEAELTQILPSVGFGFETIGTITKSAYEGNAKPRLGRLIKSKSLLVNKGFKNLGIEETLKRLQGKKFRIPTGCSIGVTNNENIPGQEGAIQDILLTFKAAEASSVSFNYYELNISCPNLKVAVEFYSPDSLNVLLSAVTGLGLKRPLFIKMPIDKSDEDVLQMLEVIAKHNVQGVIFGNLQKNRYDPAIIQAEADKFTKGNFSGKPTEKRSNELISLAYRNYKDRLTVIGCGGIFSHEDAYKKIRLGASLVQLITGMIFEGPQLITEINLGLIEMLKADGFKNISEAVGADNK